MPTYARRRGTLIKRLREPVNGLTHLAGAVLGVVALVVLARMALDAGKTRHLVGFIVFGVSMVALYSASALYHIRPLPSVGVGRWRRLDHMMIYVLIAGTYTPICLVALTGTWAWGMLCLIWGLALGGILFKLRWMHTPSWLSPALYMTMGWVGIIIAPQVYNTLSPGGLIWIVVGGVVYTVGACILGFRRPDPFPGRFGSHELWHLFVLVGTACHFWVMARYIIPLS